MANLPIINILQNRIANIYVKLKSITSQLHNTSVSIAFIEKALSLKGNSSIKRIVLQVHVN